MDGRHELVREERPQRLTDRVRRGQPRDPELVGDLRRDRRLAGAGRAADEDDERPVVHAARLLREEREDCLVEPLGHDVVPREDDAAAVRESVLDDDVDGGRLQLDEIRVGVQSLQLRAQQVAAREVVRDVDDLGVEVTGGRRPGREDGDTAAERLRRLQAQLELVEDDVADPLAERLAADEDANGRAIGGIAAPLPSKTTTSGSSDAASRAPSTTFETNGAPEMPPPARRHPTVGRPVRTASSR